MSADSNETVEVVDEIWSKDKLNRKSYADFLYQVITSAQVNNDEDNALIFSIDGDWGTGKSFFIDLWMQQLKKDGHLVSRFDAWKNDIVDEPLIGFISHIYAQISIWKDEMLADDYLTREAGDKLSDYVNSAKERALPIFTEVVKGLVKKGASYIVTDDVVDFLTSSNKDAEDASADVDKAVASNLLENKIIAHNKNIKLIEEFKNELTCLSEELTSVLEKNSPVIIFIDELDRCRPDYAVKLLEVLKHVFNSQGICFITCVNIFQLECSLKVIYGSEFNAGLYLDRFFNYRLNLPSPVMRDYIESLSFFNKINKNLNSDFTSYLLRVREYKKSHSSFIEENEINKDIISNYVDFYSKVSLSNGLRLRDVKKIFFNMELIVSIIKNQWEGVFVIKEIIFFILVKIYKNKRLKKEDFKIYKPFDDVDVEVMNFKLVYIYTNKSNNEFKKLEFQELIQFFEYIYNNEYVYLANYKELENSYSKYENILFNKVGINNGPKRIRIARRMFDSYVDACFMAAPIDPRRDVVID